MANTMRRIIEVKKYETLQEVIDRLNSFNAWGQISVDEYNDLMELAQLAYNPPVVEEATDEVVAELEVPVE